MQYNHKCGAIIAVCSVLWEHFFYVNEGKAAVSRLVRDSGASVRHVQYCWDVSLSSAAVRKCAQYKEKDAVQSQNEWHEKKKQRPRV